MERKQEAEQAAQKSALRKQMLARRDSLPAAWRGGASAAIVEKLTSLSHYQNAQALLCYASYRSEVETDGLIQKALQEQKAVYCPKVSNRAAGHNMEISHMEFYRIFSLTDLETGFRGIREPKPLPERQLTLSEEAIRSALKQSALMPSAFMRCASGMSPKLLLIMPGVVFDKRNHRIGYGGGFYDRYLERVGQAGIEGMVTTAAAAFSMQIVEQLPAERHDFTPQLVISERYISYREDYYYD